jgi:hypothetical protein
MCQPDNHRHPKTNGCFEDIAAIILGHSRIKRIYGQKKTITIDLFTHYDIIQFRIGFFACRGKFNNLTKKVTTIA